jgi:predicted Zn-dependent protease
MSTAHLKPMKSSVDTDISQLSQGEQRLWDMSDDLNKALRQSDQLYLDEPLRQYVQNVMDRLFPEFKDRIKVQLLKAPYLNAFALPDGSIYINAGILASFENEAQMATVLAHEGIHFVNRHGAKQRINRKNSAGAAVLIGLAGVPIVGEVLALSSISGYSQNLEREADYEGFSRLKAANYDVREAKKIFEKMLTEVEINKIEQPFFFSTHPELQERIKNFEKLSLDFQPSGSRIGHEDYQAFASGIRLSALKEKLQRGMHASIIHELTLENWQSYYPRQAQFFLGEAYRLRQENDDLEKAESTLLNFIGHSQSYTDAYLSLGIICLKKGRYTDAKGHFQTYLARKPDTKDSDYVFQYLKQTEEGLKQ